MAGMLSRLLSLAFAIGCGVLLAAQSPPLPEVDRFGPQVGEAVPDFALVDQAGRARDLASVLGPNGGLLVFARSAVW